jgi:hypothetical protein
LLGLDLGHLRQTLKRPLDALLALAGGALAGRLLAASGRSRVGIELFLEALDLRARRL